MLTSRRLAGFTIVELLIGIAIMAILAALGVPSLAAWLQNSKINNVAQDIFSGVQMARTEAIRRNVRVDFVLTNTPVDTVDLANALTPSVTGVNWAVRAASDVAGQPFVLVAANGGTTGANSGTATKAADVDATGPAGFDGTVSFNGFGGPVVQAAYTFGVSKPQAGTCVALGGDIRCKAVVVTAGGRISACDPAAPAGDSRACPP